MEIELWHVLIAIGLGWAGWVSLRTIKNANEISVMAKNDENIESELLNLTDKITTMTTELKSSFKELEKEVKDDVGGVNRRLDMFLKNEIDELKKLAGL